MRKWFALFLALVMLVTVAGCAKPENSKPKGEDKPADNATQVETGRLLPEKITVPADGEIHEIDLKWTENSCTFTIGEPANVMLFTYDEADRSLDITVTRDGETQTMKDICVFDEQGRVEKMFIRSESDVPLAFSYEGDTIKALSMPESEEFSPCEVIWDKKERKLQMAPFGDSENYLYFDEHGNFYKANDQIGYTYEYDDKGNITRLSWGEDSAEGMDITYGSTPMTESWQQAPLCLVKTFLFGTSFALFAMEMMGTCLF